MAALSGGRGRTPNRVRVIGGRLRNSRLEVPDVPGLRPTPERVRETLFNWLAPVIAAARCLDLCAGTGALGIEALSRGAAFAQFVEADAAAAQALRDNLARLRVPDAAVASADAREFLRLPAQPVDIVFLDPPFALDGWTPLAALLEQGGWLAAPAWIYLEMPHDARPALPDAWRMHREGRAGLVRYALYRR